MLTHDFEQRLEELFAKYRVEFRTSLREALRETFDSRSNELGELKSISESHFPPDSNPSDEMNPDGESQMELLNEDSEMEDKFASVEKPDFEQPIVETVHHHQFAKHFEGASDATQLFDEMSTRIVDIPIVQVSNGVMGADNRQCNRVNFDSGGREDDSRAKFGGKVVVNTEAPQVFDELSVRTDKANDDDEVLDFEKEVFDAIPALEITKADATVVPEPRISSVATELVSDTDDLLTDLGLVHADTSYFQCGSTVVKGSFNGSTVVHISIEQVVKSKGSYAEYETVESHEMLSSELRIGYPFIDLVNVADPYGFRLLVMGRIVHDVYLVRSTFGMLMDLWQTDNFSQSKNLFFGISFVDAKAILGCGFNVIASEMRPTSGFNENKSFDPGTFQHFFDVIWLLENGLSVVFVQNAKISIAILKQCGFFIGNFVDFVCLNLIPKEHLLEIVSKLVIGKGFSMSFMWLWGTLRSEYVGLDMGRRIMQDARLFDPGISLAANWLTVNHFSDLQHIGSSAASVIPLNLAVSDSFMLPLKSILTKNMHATFVVKQWLIPWYRCYSFAFILEDKDDLEEKAILVGIDEINYALDNDQMNEFPSSSCSCVLLAELVDRWEIRGEAILVIDKRVCFSETNCGKYEVLLQRHQWLLHEKIVNGIGAFNIFESPAMVKKFEVQMIFALVKFTAYSYHEQWLAKSKQSLLGLWVSMSESLDK